MWLSKVVFGLVQGAVSVGEQRGVGLVQGANNGGEQRGVWFGTGC